MAINVFFREDATLTENVYFFKSPLAKTDGKNRRRSRKKECAVVVRRNKEKENGSFCDKAFSLYISFAVGSKHRYPITRSTWYFPIKSHSHRAPRATCRIRYDVHKKKRKKEACKKAIEIGFCLSSRAHIVLHPEFPLLQHCETFIYSSRGGGGGRRKWFDIVIKSDRGLWV